MTQEQKPSWTPKTRLDYRLMHRLLARLARLAFGLYGRWEIIGLENVPRTGGLLLASNHASAVDPPLGWAALYGYRRAWGIARDDLWSNPFLGYLMDSIGVVPVRRNAPDLAMFRAALKLLGEGEVVGLFPEGTRTPDGLLHAARPGIAMLIQKSGVPVMPCALIGTYEMMPRGAQFPKRVRLKVVFGKPLTFTRENSREEITTTIMDAIANLLTANGHPTASPVGDPLPIGGHAKSSDTVATSSSERNPSKT